MFRPNLCACWISNPQDRMPRHGTIRISFSNFFTFVLGIIIDTFLWDDRTKNALKSWDDFLVEVIFLKGLELFFSLLFINVGVLFTSQ